MAACPPRGRRPRDQGPAHAGRRLLSPTLQVAAGGAAGTLARYGLLTAFPFLWATLSINIAGSLALAVLLAHVPRWRPLLGTGFLGGFTTMSALAVDADRLVADGRALTAAAYVLASVAGGLAAVRMVRR